MQPTIKVVILILPFSIVTYVAKVSLYMYCIGHRHYSVCILHYPVSPCSLKTVLSGLLSVKQIKDKNAPSSLNFGNILMINRERMKSVAQPFLM